MKRYTVEEMLRAAKRELGQRQRVYPRLVESGRMVQADAIRETETMAAIVELLQKMADEKQPSLFHGVRS